MCSDSRVLDGGSSSGTLVIAMLQIAHKQLRDAGATADELKELGLGLGLGRSF